MEKLQEAQLAFEAWQAGPACSSWTNPFISATFDAIADSHANSPPLLYYDKGNVCNRLRSLSEAANYGGSSDLNRRALSSRMRALCPG